MEVLLDTTALTLFLKPSVPPPNDPTTGKPLTYAAMRIEHALAQLSAAHGRLLIPATVWAEFLVCADESAQDYLDKIKDKANFEVVPFDHIAAIEAALDQRKARQRGNAKADLSGTRQCIKADRQIVAIAKTRRVDAVIATDGDIARICESMNVKFVGLWELDIPTSSTPLLDHAEADLGDTGVAHGEIQTSDPAPSDSTAPTPPASQSHDDVKAKEPQTEPAPPSAPLDVPAQQQPDSSQTVAPPPRSKQ